MRIAYLGKHAVLTAAIALMLGGCGATTGDNNEAAAPSVAPAGPSVPPEATPAHGAAAPTAPKPSTGGPPSAEATASSPQKPEAPASPPQKPQISPEFVPKFTADHIVVIVEENHSYNQIVGNKNAPYINQLIEAGALYTSSHGVAHPSQPNYLALFSGSTQGMKDDSCGKTYTSANLASELIRNHLSFIGYSEDLPKSGYTGCSAKGYARKHNPWAQFTNLAAGLNEPLTAFPQDFSKLPTVSFVIPNHQDDMHDGTVQQADTWLKEHMSSYVTWAAAHNSLLIVTWDEDDNSKINHIPTIFVGPMVKPGKYDDQINHYNVLRTIEDMYRLTPLGESANAAAVSALRKQ